MVESCQFEKGGLGSVEGATPQEGGAEGLNAEGVDGSQCLLKTRHALAGNRHADGLIFTTVADPKLFPKRSNPCRPAEPGR